MAALRVRSLVDAAARVAGDQSKWRAAHSSTRSTRSPVPSSALAMQARVSDSARLGSVAHAPTIASLAPALAALTPFAVRGAPVTVLGLALCLAGCAADSSRPNITSVERDPVERVDPTASNGGSASPPQAQPADRAAEVKAPPIGSVARVGGDLNARAEWTGGAFRSGSSHIDTPLPEGYPPPTPPGAIEIKTYPVVRRAEVSGRVWPELGMNLAFFPLFNHIKRRGIEMTSPVEMDYRGLSVSDPQGAAGDWSMAFLYRRVEQGPLGRDERDGRVSVIDSQPMTVVSVGLRGGYGLARTREGLAILGEWLDANPEWTPAGPVRVLHYNGPDTRERDRWQEVQVPVRPTHEPPVAADR